MARLNVELGVLAIPENYFDWAELFINLVNMLSDWYKWTGNINNLEATIKKAELIIVTILKNYLSHAKKLHNHAIILSKRYNWTGYIDDL